MGSLSCSHRRFRYSNVLVFAEKVVQLEWNAGYRHAFHLPERHAERQGAVPVQRLLPVALGRQATQHNMDVRIGRFLPELLHVGLQWFG